MNNLGKNIALLIVIGLLLYVIFQTFQGPGITPVQSSMPFSDPLPAEKLPTRAQNAFAVVLPIVLNAYCPLKTAFPKTTLTVTAIVSVARALHAKASG